MRLFFASFISPESTNLYESLVEELIAECPGVLRSVPGNSLHLTLAFLGEIAEQDVTSCLEALGVAGDFRAFSFSLGHPRILSARKTPRLVKADVIDGSERIMEVQERLRGKLLESLPKLDIRPKPPHVTLARFKKNATREAARKVADLLSQREDPSRIRTEEFVNIQLVKSKLTPAGPIYETLGESSLSSGEISS